MQSKQAEDRRGLLLDSVRLYLRHGANGVCLYSVDKSRTIELRMETDCEALIYEIEAVTFDLGEELIQPVTALSLGGISGFYSVSRGSRRWYCEAWLQLEEYALRIIIRSSAGMSADEAKDCLTALDIQLDPE